MTRFTPKYNFLILAGALVACFFLFSARSHAGEKEIFPVYADEWLEGSSYFVQMGGTLSDTRNSANTSDVLYCSVAYRVGGAPTGFCYAQSSATNTTTSCQTTDAEFIQLITSLKGDSYVAITATQLSGELATCNTIAIENSSAIAPKQP